MVKVVIKSLKILEIISAAAGRAVKLSEIAAALGENASTCAGIVKTMTDAGYLQRDPVRGYRLGVLSASLIHGDLYDPALLLSARDVLLPLAAENQLYMSLAVVRANVRHSVMEVDHTGQMVMQFHPNPVLLNSATGLMLVSHMSRAEIDRILDIYALPPRFHSGSELANALYMYRSQGYVELERPDGVLAVAVPVLHQGKLVASLGSMLEEADRERVPVYTALDILRRGAHQIEDELSAAL